MSNSTITRVSVLATLFAFAAVPLAAQTITIDEGCVLTAGSTVQVAFSDPSKAGEDVTVTVTGGFPVPTSTTLTITLDENGEGSTSWVVSTLWRSVSFTGSGAPEVVCAII
jgi:hypothetical protein